MLTTEEYQKELNVIASYVHTLRLTNRIDTVRLVADGCGGQNKNTTPTAICSKWLYAFAAKSVQKP